MKLEIRYKGGMVQTFDTENMTTNAPGGGVAGMVRTVATYSPVEASAPFGEADKLAAGLWVHLYQYNVDSVMANNAREMKLVGRFAIVSEAGMGSVRTVKKDGEIWLARDWLANDLMDLTELNTFGFSFVQGYAGLSICAALLSAIEAAEGLGLLMPGWAFADVADLFGLPAPFVERVMTVGFADSLADGEADGDAVE